MTEAEKPTNLIAILTADWHYMPHAWRHRPEINSDAWTSLLQVSELALESKLPIIAAGDLFDISRLPSTWVEDMQTMFSCNIPDGHVGLCINGNHDKSKPPWMSAVFHPKACSSHCGWHHLPRREDVLAWFPESIGWCKYKPLPDTVVWTQELPAWTGTEMWDVYGIDYVETMERLQEELDHLEPLIRNATTNLLVLHQGVDGLLPKKAAELFDGMIPDRIDFVLCGHTHISKIFQIKTKGGKSIPLLSPGSLHLCSIDEGSKKKIYALAADGAVWSTPLITRRVLSVDFSGGTESEIRAMAVKIAASLHKKSAPHIEKIRENIKVPIVRVTYNSTTVPKVRSIFETALREAGAEAHLFYKNRAEKVSNDLDSVMDNGIDTSFVTSGFDYAKTVFQGLEKDRNVRKLVETILETQPSQENYTALKEEFLYGTSKKKTKQV